jgi:hypothetical protein
VVDVRPGERGTLLGVRVRDGAIATRIPLLGQGRPYVLPLVHDGVIYVSSAALQDKGGWLEAYRIGP